ncbi:MAG: hypothetical protein LBU86_05430, partial [Oscillospiraceae bacterium]|nr:hypothetical protein [Oscillospiraceae bacterium]
DNGTAPAGSGASGNENSGAEQTPPLPTSIDDQPVPLAALPTGRWALVNLILSFAGALLAIAAAVRAVRLNNSTPDNSDKKRYLQKPFTLFWITIGLGIAGVAVFLSTENMWQPVGLADRWTIVNEIILAAQAVAAALAHREKRVAAPDIDINK